MEHVELPRNVHRKKYRSVGADREQFRSHRERRVENERKTEHDSRHNDILLPQESERNDENVRGKERPGGPLEEKKREPQRERVGEPRARFGVYVKPVLQDRIAEDRERSRKHREECVFQEFPRKEIHRDDEQEIKEDSLRERRRVSVDDARQCGEIGRIRRLQEALRYRDVAWDGYTLPGEILSRHQVRLVVAALSRPEVLELQKCGGAPENEEHKQHRDGRVPDEKSANVSGCHSLASPFLIPQLEYDECPQLFPVIRPKRLILSH